MVDKIVGYLIPNGNNRNSFNHWSKYVIDECSVTKFINHNVMLWSSFRGGTSVESGLVLIIIRLVMCPHWISFTKGVKRSKWHFSLKPMLKSLRNLQAMCMMLPCHSNKDFSGLRPDDTKKIVQVDKINHDQTVVLNVKFYNT